MKNTQFISWIILIKVALVLKGSSEINHLKILSNRDWGTAERDIVFIPL